MSIAYHYRNCSKYLSYKRQKPKKFLLYFIPIYLIWIELSWSKGAKCSFTVLKEKQIEEQQRKKNISKGSRKVCVFKKPIFLRYGATILRR